MFFISRLSRTLRLTIFLVITFVASLIATQVISVGPANATGEKYTWNSSNGSISATSGVYSSPASIAKITNGPNSGKWHITSDSKLVFNGGKSCTVGERTGTSPLYTVSSDNKTIKWAGTWEGDSTACAAAQGPYPITGGSISGNPGKGNGSGGSSSPSSCGSYSNGTKEYSACQQGKSYAGQNNTSAAAESACDKQPLGGESKTSSLVTACKVGVQLATMPELFTDVRSAACEGESGGVAASCQSAFDTALNKCIAKKSDLNSVKSCMKKAYPSLASQINNVQIAVDTPTPDTPPSGSSCAVEGIGWIVCPVMNFMARLNDAAFGMLNNFLGVNSKLTASSGLKKGWEIFRNIANICFVIAFLIIIYSQLTGAGITNYGIKRLLPKLIIAAILVNASIYICQIAVDVSNIVGSSIYDLLKGLGSGDVSSAGAGGELWAKAVGAVLAVVAGALLLVAIILAPTSLIALGAAVIVLTARQAIIVLLIVVSPLAFVAYLLPNTESWFKRWWKMFSTMLMLYPVVGLVFGASTLAADILYSVGNSGNDKSMMLMALGVMAVPLFAVPTLLKGALAAAGSIGNQVAKLQGKANSFAGKGAKGNLKRHGESLEARMAGSNNRFARFAGGYRNRRAFGRKSMETETARQQEAALSSHVRNNPKKYSTQQQAIAYQAVDKAWDENVKAHQALYSSKSFDEDQLLEDMNDSRLSHEQRAAAAGIVAEKGSRKAQLQALRHASALHRSGDEAAEGMQKQMSAQMGSRRPFGLSDTQAAALRTGKYEGDIDADTATRATEKLAPAGIPDLDPDDLTLIKKKVEDGTISGTELSELRTSIGSAYTDPRVSQRIKPQARADLDAILAHGGTESSQTTTP